MKYFQIIKSIRSLCYQLKHLISAKQNKNEQKINDVSNGQIGLRNDINRKEITENEN